MIFNDLVITLAKFAQEIIANKLKKQPCVNYQKGIVILKKSEQKGSIIYEIDSNQESDYGRYDIALIPKDSTQLGIIMELKVVDDFYEETKDAALASALQQIKEKEYQAGLRKRGITDILILVVTFDGKRVWVREG